MLKQVMYNSGVQLADGQIHTWHWTAPTKVQVRSVLAWLGAAAGRSSDVSVTVFSTGLPVLLFFGMDRYAPPTAPHQWPEHYGPGEAVIEAGGQIAAHFGGQVLDGILPHPPVHCLIIVNYEEIP